MSVGIKAFESIEGKEKQSFFLQRGVQMKRSNLVEAFISKRKLFHFIER